MPGFLKLILVIFGLILAYLIISRVETKRNEDFEERDN